MSDRIALLGIKNVLTIDDLVLYTGYARATLKALPLGAIYLATSLPLCVALQD